MSDLDNEEIEKIKWERDYYKLRFEELDKHWNNIIEKILGKDYYNDGCDWCSCDNFAEEDILRQYKKRWWKFWI